MASPLYGMPAKEGVPPPLPRPSERPDVRQALLEALQNLDEARAAVAAALHQPVIDTCSVFIQRAGTQTGHARNNLVRAYTCLQAPPNLRPYMSFRRVPAPPPRF